MCLTRPAEVLSAAGDTAQVLWRGEQLTVDTSLLGPVAPGERLLIHAGLAIERVSAEDAGALDELLDVWDQTASDILAGNAGDEAGRASAAVGTGEPHDHA